MPSRVQGLGLQRSKRCKGLGRSCAAVRRNASSVGFSGHNDGQGVADFPVVDQLLAAL